MFDSQVLNVVIGLVFIYSLYSLLVTTINEIIASIFSLRAANLKKGIKRMLTDDNKTNEMVNKFYRQPLIKFLGETNSKKPSYLTSKSFANALVQLCNDFAGDESELNKKLLEGIAKIKEGNPETGSYLESIYNEANGDINKFKELSENWFNETMERASGWYKKLSQKITFGVAFSIALIFNVDTIEIVKNLSANPKRATEMVEMADKYSKFIKNNPSVPAKDPSKQLETSLKNAQKLVAANSDIQNSNAVLGLGWSIPKDRIHNKLVDKSNFKKITFILEEAFTKSLAGLLLTALAISLGAPFWFDLLNKLMQLRGSKKVEETKN